MRKIRICLNKSFCSKQIKLDKYKQKLFSPQNEPHMAKLYFSLVLKQFWGNSLKNSLFNKKSDYLRKKFRKN